MNDETTKTASREIMVLAASVVVPSHDSVFVARPAMSLRSTDDAN